MNRTIRTHVSGFAQSECKESRTHADWERQVANQEPAFLPVGVTSRIMCSSHRNPDLGCSLVWRSRHFKAQRSRRSCREFCTFFYFCKIFLFFLANGKSISLFESTSPATEVSHPLSTFQHPKRLKPTGTPLSYTNIKIHSCYYLVIFI